MYSTSGDICGYFFLKSMPFVKISLDSSLICFIMKKIRRWSFLDDQTSSGPKTLPTKYLVVERSKELQMHLTNFEIIFVSFTSQKINMPNVRAYFIV